MSDLLSATAQLIAAAQTISDLVPYLVVMGLGFLIGAWGQSARVPIAIVAGILLILLAIAGFMLDNSSGSSGVPGFG